MASTPRRRAVVTGGAGFWAPTSARRCGNELSGPRLDNFVTERLPTWIT